MQGQEAPQASPVLGLLQAAPVLRLLRVACALPRGDRSNQQVLDWFNNENLFPTENFDILAVRAGG